MSLSRKKFSDKKKSISKQGGLVLMMQNKSMMQVSKELDGRASQVTFQHSFRHIPEER